MKPDFALSLSFEGIALLMRSAGGWRLAGEVSLQDPDLAGALAALRARAVELGDSAFRTKLIIPNDQIRYLTVDTGHVSTADRIEKVRTALDGATPYAVDELVYDLCVDGAQTHVAAVARDTLEEAENFALEHRFNPVSFVAVPGDEAFLGEPFFGPTAFCDTALAAGQRVEPDGIAVVITGTVEDAPTQAAPDPKAALTEVPPPVAPEDTVLPEPDPEPAEDLSDVPLPGFTSRRGSAAALPEKGPTRSTIAPQIEPEPEAVDPPDPAALSASFAAPAPASAPEEPAGWAARFLSRRSNEDAPPDIKESEAPAARAVPVTAPPVRPMSAAPAPLVAATITPDPRMAMPDPPDERARMTIFGMRETHTPARGGAPRHLGLILTGVLLLFLAGVAAWASVFMDDGVAALFDREPEPEQVAVVPPEVVALPEREDPEPEAVTVTEAPQQVALLDPGETGLTDTDAAVLDALREPTPPAPPTVLDPETAQTRYAVTGIWQRAPDPPTEPGLVSLDDLYLTSIDGRVAAQDAVALPGATSFITDLPLGEVLSPAAPGSRFALDDNGRVLPTPEGALSPDGFTVYLGAPPVTPPPTPTRFAVTPDIDPVTEAILTARPRLRPADLVAQTERTQLGGLTRDELADIRPRLRPQIDKTEDEADQTPTAQAVLASVTPRLRPGNMASLVDRAERSTEAPAPQQVAAAATTVTPRLPSSASVARAATLNNAINLRRVNLIGVYGTPSDRRALVRLPNGRYKKVQVGDRLDGGRISAIGESELRYQKGGRNLVLKIPSG